MGHDPRKRDSPTESGTVGRYIIYMTKIFRRCTISVGLAPLSNYIPGISNLLLRSLRSLNKYSENSDNSTDKGGSLSSPIIYIFQVVRHARVVNALRANVGPAG